MTLPRLNLRLVLAALILFSAVPTWAQADAPSDTSIEQRIRERFTSMLRSELALSDEQAAVVLPAMADLEDAKRELGRERRETVRDLQRGMSEGASDEELQRKLDRLGTLDQELSAVERTAMTRIDAELNVRQRVKLRFFVQRFRTELRERMSLRSERLDQRRDRRLRRNAP